MLQLKNDDGENPSISLEEQPVGQIFPDKSKSVKSIGLEKDYGPHYDYDKKRSPEDYEREIDGLKHTLEQVNSHSDTKLPWYETLPLLTQQERDIMRYISKQKEKNIPMNQIENFLKKQYQLTNNQISQLIKSAFVKWNVFVNEEVQAAFDTVIA